MAYLLAYRVLARRGEALQRGQRLTLIDPAAGIILLIVLVSERTSVRIIIGITLVVLAVFLFWQHLVNYERVYFRPAVGLAAVKTAYWPRAMPLVRCGVLGVSRFMAPGALRYLVRGMIWWAVSSILNELVWKPSAAN